MKTTPLHADFGVEIHGLDLRDVARGEHWDAVRSAFEIHSALLFRNQSFSDATHLALAQRFGPLENRDAMAAGRDVAFEIPQVSNQTEDGVSAATDLHTLNLQANMLWHTDSTFLPVPALCNILTARVVPASGGETELASTRAGWADMPAPLKEKLHEAIIWHRLSHSRARISPELAALPEMNLWPDRPWRAIWPNPVTGQDALYIASHSFAVEGRSRSEGQVLIDAAIDHCTKPDRIYTHRWREGDVLIWDERACLHRGRPWDYDQPRTLSSICCSATDADGLAHVRVVA